MQNDPVEKAMQFCFAKTLPPTDYVLNGVNLIITNAENDLSVWIDKKLDFDKHIITKVKTGAGIIDLSKKIILQHHS